MEPRPPWTLELWISVQPSWSWRDTRYSEPTVVIPRYIGCAKRNLDLDNNHLNDLRELFERRIWHTILYQLFLQFIVTHLLFFLINLCKKYTFILIFIYIFLLITIESTMSSQFQFNPSSNTVIEDQESFSIRVASPLEGGTKEIARNRFEIEG